MARHWFKIFLPNGPGRGPRLQPEASPRPEAQALAGSSALVRDLVLAGSPVLVRDLVLAGSPVLVRDLVLAWERNPVLTLKVSVRAPEPPGAPGSRVQSMITDSFDRIATETVRDHEPLGGAATP